MSLSDTKAELKKLAERLHDPRQLRLLATGLMLAVGYVAIYMPLSSRIEESTRKLRREQKRNELAEDVERLRRQVETLQTRVPEDTDVNEWVQYVLDGIRRTPLKLATLDSGNPQRVGPYEAIVLHLELEGAFHDLDGFLEWIESNQRFFRVDSARIAPPRNQSDQRLMQLTLLGLRA